ncbi:MAG TPA: tRNA (N(6)-L-threonylcarbamoyladenosine(37)-C(2))-methylthiotransferase MtaB [Vicinamibacterales bacterium]|nr:tRNA (N(6)-L-threonylcarbamoyladenosine(37)-C(2))-methylthiotransferase MtaB [Vicinamibacterales bacterium]
MKYSIVTFGCRVNQADSLGFEEELLSRGGIAVPPADADVVVVNTCSVTATADQGARQTIRRIARDNPAARIVATGCYATRRPQDVADLPNVVRVIRNDDKPRAVSLLATDFGLTTAVRFGEGDGSCGAPIEPRVAGRTAFTLRVQTGCDETCSYCVIPTTRGHSRSVPVDDVLAQIDRIVAAGFKEIALTGVHLGSYGRDLSPASSLIQLLRRIDVRRATLLGSPLFRISSLEPMDCSREIVDLVAHRGCFAPHFHLPLQHASNRMLTAMRRPYTIEYYSTLVDDIRTRIPHASIGSDAIVGFPGETDEDFSQLSSYLERSPLTHVHVFPYSDRPGTAATAMGGKVSGSTIRERGRQVRDIAQRLSQRFRQSQVGTRRPALTIDDGTTAVTDNYLRVRIPPGKSRNEWIQVVVE